MALISRILRNGTDGRLIWWCPGCNEAHTIQTGQGDGHEWMMRHPKWGRCCHSFVVDGRMQFLGDCTHALAGQMVDIPDWPRLSWSDA